MVVGGERVWGCHCSISGYSVLEIRLDLFFFTSHLIANIFHLVGIVMRIFERQESNHTKRGGLISRHAYYIQLLQLAPRPCLTRTNLHLVISLFNHEIKTRALLSLLCLPASPDQGGRSGIMQQT